MTQPTTGARFTATGDGLNDSFGYTVRIFAASDLKVYLDAVLQASGYSVTGVFNNDGGSVVFDAAPGAGVKVLIVADPPSSQPVNYLSGAADSETLERGFDRLALSVKALLDHRNRSLRLPLSDPAAGLAELPPLEQLKGAVLGFDPVTGAPVAAGATLDAALVSVFVATLLLAGDAAAFRSLIGIVLGDAIGNVPQLVDVGGNPGLGAYDGSQLLNVGGNLPIGATMPFFFAAVPAGWLLLNGETVGDAASSADHADDGYEDFFLKLWADWADADAAVVTGRGASAAADWAAHKKITLPDWRGRAIIGAGAGAGLTARTLGTKGGAETHLLTAAQSGLPAHAHNAQMDVVGTAAGAQPAYQAGGTAQAIVAANTPASAAEAHPNMQPWGALHWIVKAS